MDSDDYLEELDGELVVNDVVVYRYVEDWSCLEGVVGIALCSFKDDNHGPSSIGGTTVVKRGFTRYVKNSKNF